MDSCDDVITPYMEGPRSLFVGSNATDRARLRQCVCLLRWQNLCCESITSVTIALEKWVVNPRLFVNGRSERPPFEGRDLTEEKEKIQNSKFVLFRVIVTPSAITFVQRHKLT